MKEDFEKINQLSQQEIQKNRLELSQRENMLKKEIEQLKVHQQEIEKHRKQEAERQNLEAKMTAEPKKQLSKAMD